MRSLFREPLVAMAPVLRTFLDHAIRVAARRGDAVSSHRTKEG